MFRGHNFILYPTIDIVSKLPPSYADIKIPPQHINSQNKNRVDSQTMASKKRKLEYTDKGSEEVRKSCKKCLEKDTHGTSRAVKYCLTCKDYLCETCLNAHKLMWSPSGHDFVKIPENGDIQELTSALTCQKHPGWIIDMICKTHDELGCYRCMSTEHDHW